MQPYCNGENIPLKEITIENKQKEHKYCILQWKDRGMSVAKIVDEELKNKFLK